MDILVVNDDLMEHSVIQQVLIHSGHQVTFIEALENAWKLIEEKSFRFVIVDATADEQNVHRFIQRVRSTPTIRQHVYILLLTNKGQNGELIASLGVGADDYITKPLVPQELKARVTVGARLLSVDDDLVQARDNLNNLAVYDPLTGLMNKHAFYKQAQGELERARRASESVSIITLDVVNFKAINEKYGLTIGDEVLQIIAQIIREKSRPYDCIGRWDGDQFAIALPGVISTDAEKIAKRILGNIQSSQVSLHDGTELEIKVSAGISSAQYINAYAEIDTFIQAAVRALHTARETEGEQINVAFI